MISYKYENENDYVAIRDLTISTFFNTFGTGEEEAILIEDARSQFQHHDLISVVAYDENRLVGHIFFSPVYIKGKPHKALVVAPFSVLEQFRNRRIGSTIINMGICRAIELGFNMIFVTGNPKLYSKYGFKCIIEKGYSLPFPKIPDRDHQVLELSSNLVSDGGEVIYPKLWEKFK